VIAADGLDLYQADVDLKIVTAEKNAKNFAKTFASQ
jgi:hypothetical protein